VGETTFGVKHRQVLSRDKLAEAFGTPVSTYLWPDSEAFNTSLARAILARKHTDPGITKSNVGGWHSTFDLLDWPDPVCAALRERVLCGVLDMIRLTARPPKGAEPAIGLEAWANVSETGNYNSVHDHPSSLWSGVYYVETFRESTSDLQNGRLEFFDPRPAVHHTGGMFAPATGRFLVAPIPGLMVLFPGWLAHMVHPFRGDGRRVSISFNSYVQEAGGRR
jgi:uncharacterized protein (TIGR02466 family)